MKFAKAVKNLANAIDSETIIGISKAVAPYIFKGAAICGTMYLAEKFGVPVSINPIEGNIKVDNYSNVVRFPKRNSHISTDDILTTVSQSAICTNSDESAILSMLELAKASDSTYYMNEYVKNIYEIARKGTDDKTKQFAISAIGIISNNCDSEYYKNQWGRYIMNLVK